MRHHSRINAQVVFGDSNWSTNINGVYNDYFDVREWNWQKVVFLIKVEF
jgi:hypothetical protein